MWVPGSFERHHFPCTKEYVEGYVDTKDAKESKSDCPTTVNHFSHSSQRVFVARVRTHASYLHFRKRDVSNDNTVNHLPVAAQCMKRTGVTGVLTAKCHVA